MKVYHGSYCIVNKPNVLFSRDALDFGKGFYVTNIEQQVISWGNRFKLKFEKAYVNNYEIDIEEVKKKYNRKSFNILWS